MGRGTLGNPRVKESKAARQARLLRALEHRVRRLEKLARPAVIYDAMPIPAHELARLASSPGQIEQDRINREMSEFVADWPRSDLPAPLIDADSLIGEQVLRPCSEPFNYDALSDRIQGMKRVTEDLITQAKDRQEIAARLSRETQQRIRAQADSACPGKSRTRRAALLARLRGLLGRLWRGAPS
jgi:hypothetical protein